MERQRAKINRSSYENATYEHKHRIKHYERVLSEYRDDPEQGRRLELVECKCCYYLNRGRIGGAAVTARQCGLCAVRIINGNTNIGVLCRRCAKARGLCAQCGGDLGGVMRRKVDLEPSAG